MQREQMEFDVVIVGAGPAGLSTACRLMQQANEAGKELSICVVEKGAEVGAHILSGAIIEPRALNELFPNWEELGAPLSVPVTEDQIYFLRDSEKSIKVSNIMTPKSMHNHGNYIASVGNLCRWLAEQAENLGVEIFPGFAADRIVYGEDGRVAGISTGDMGLDSEGKPKANYMAGMDLLAKYTIFSEGCRGHLGKELIAKFDLDDGVDPQHYGLGIKELWEIPNELHQPGLVLHGTGWPLSDSASTGGFFLYHTDNNQIVVGLITDLNYSNPHVSPYDEFQRMKHHPLISKYLSGGKRISYGARAIAKGGLNSLPKMTMPGALLLGCDAGTLNFSKIKGTHTAMKSGILAADVLFPELISQGNGGLDLVQYKEVFKQSWLHDELFKSRNFGAALHKYGTLVGGALNVIEQNIVSFPFTLHDTAPDYACLKPADECKSINYPKPDGLLSFDKPSSVFLSNTYHEEDQPCHLKLKDGDVPLSNNLPVFNEPAQRYCPAGVYEVLDDGNGAKRFQINSQNCVHCKTCDIKDPAQNITWTVPEGAGGPSYPNM
ncbi:electron transfer flavoprotein-ubiquinone oxidoreductase [Marinomonas sp. C2222]|uniref:Electron transfer flavoprotein-ubiquinone oxidoreductase n=1 Tax=Marinomonas sargassi TaxID=2984494 RepID=A0ABT2YPX3_9GAMM|nr:electron transfer flavoprotein-ubiquinone oxidoreductase [Marinomonas sargassi]MCV2401928.1 electron transfer flavoprotein-ubiquinone oxidoreductase [Marinomonas sargassi]